MRHQTPLPRANLPTSMTLRILLAALAALVVTSSALATDSAVIINEVQFHPANEATQSEWIELRNLHGVDIDLSG